MKISIMCGGKGKRLKELTAHIPKPLLKLNNKTILEIKIEQYIRQGFNEFIFCIGYKGKLIKEVIKKQFPKINAKFSDAGEHAGILSRIYKITDLFEDSILMTYGDTFSDINFSHFCEAHKKSDNEVTIVASPIQNPFGLVEFDKDNKITYFKEKPIFNYYIGYAIINKSAFGSISDHIINMPDGEGLIAFYQTLMDVKKLGVYHHLGLQVTFNTREELIQAEKKIIKFYTVTEGENE